MRVRPFVRLEQPRYAACRSFGGGTMLRVLGLLLCLSVN
ncbi:MAG: hypothetical protein ACI9MC_000500, partial [Kiritimatiellia bacterium]